MFVLGKAYQPSVNWGRLLGLHTNIRLSWKGLPEIKTILFGPFVSYYKGKSFITLAPEAYTLKLFTALTLAVS